MAGEVALAQMIENLHRMAVSGTPMSFDMGRDYLHQVCACMRLHALTTPVRAGVCGGPHASFVVNKPLQALRGLHGVASFQWLLFKPLITEPHTLPKPTCAG